MNYLFSSIAWSHNQSDEMATLLRANGFHGIEIAPGLFDRPLLELTPLELRTMRMFWEQQDLPIHAMQALLHGKSDLRLFGTSEERSALAHYLRLVFRVAGALGASRLVFGSPRNRTRGTLGAEAAFDTAVSFFKERAREADAEGCTLCLEANAVGYDCDFVTTHYEALDLVAAVGTPGFGVQVDTGVMLMNGEDPAALVAALKGRGFLPQHVHVSQPWLAPVDATLPFHAAMATALRSVAYDGFISVEMKTPEFFHCITLAAQSIPPCYGATS